MWGQWATRVATAIGEARRDRIRRGLAAFGHRESYEYATAARAFA
jgi:hypothetical protein